MIGVERGYVLRNPEGNHCLVKPIDRAIEDRKIVVVDLSRSNGNVSEGSQINYSVSAFRPEKSTDLGTYVRDDDRMPVEVIDGVMHHNQRADFFSAKVIPEMQAYCYSDLERLFTSFNQPGEIPILTIHSQEYFVLERVVTPFQKTDRRHMIYKMKSRGEEKRRKFVGTELVAGLSRDDTYQIHQSNGPIPGDVTHIERAQTRIFPFVNILFTSDRYYVLHMVTGAEDVRKQLDMWMIHDEQLERDFL